MPDLIPDTPALRDEVLSVLDAPRPVDIYLEEGVTFDLGGAMLEVISLPGHMREEFGWLDRTSGVLILGDAITGLDWPIFHGHLSVEGYRQSLAKLKRLLDAGEVQHVLFAHFPPMSPAQTRQLIADAERYIAQVEATIIRVLAGEPAVTLEAIWTQTCARMGRQREFRALGTVLAHLQDLQSARLGGGAGRWTLYAALATVQRFHLRIGWWQIWTGVGAMPTMSADQLPGYVGCLPTAG